MHGYFLFEYNIAFNLFSWSLREDGRTCGTMEYHERLMQTDPVYRNNRIAIENFTENYMRSYLSRGEPLRTGTLIIPVVVHVVYNTAAQNISNAQIQSQIRILNEDFRKLNADVANVPAVFQPLAADAVSNSKLLVLQEQKHLN